MSKRPLFVCVAAALLAGVPAWGQGASVQEPTTLSDRPLCASGRIMAPPIALPAGFRLSATTDPKNPHECDVAVLSADGAAVYNFGDYSVSLNGATGAGVTDDGVPAVVLSGFSGGTHCCTSSAIVSLGPHPGLLWQFDIWAGMYPQKPPANMITIEDESYIRDAARNRVAILTADNFTTDAALPPHYGVYVMMAFEISGSGFADVSRDLIPYQANADQARG
ncbi:MAG: hypothetical protein ACRD1E_03270, partial [Terriglobales bacterium]